MRTRVLIRLWKPQTAFWISIALLLTHLSFCGASEHKLESLCAQIGVELARRVGVLDDDASCAQIEQMIPYDSTPDIALPVAEWQLVQAKRELHHVLKRHLSGRASYQELITSKTNFLCLRDVYRAKVLRLPDRNQDWELKLGRGSGQKITETTVHKLLELLVRINRQFVTIPSDFSSLTHFLERWKTADATRLIPHPREAALARFLFRAKTHLSNPALHPKQLAAYFLHALIKIQAFDDGNGRTALAFTNHYLRKQGAAEIPFSQLEKLRTLINLSPSEQQLIAFIDRSIQRAVSYRLCSFKPLNLVGEN